MKKLVLLTLMLLCNTVLAQIKVKGVIESDYGKLNGVHIKNQKNDEILTVSKNDGAFEFELDEPSLVGFSFVGMQTQLIRIEESENNLEINLFAEVEELENVEVVKKRKKTYIDKYREYNLNKNLIKTFWGFLDKERASFQMRMLNEDEMPQTGGDLAFMLRGKFPGIYINNDAYGTREIYLRPTFSLDAIAAGYDIDGQLFDTYPDWLDTNDIMRIAIIPSRSANVRYGTFGKGGIILINTYRANTHPIGEDGKPIDLALLRYNKFNQEAITYDDNYRNFKSYVMNAGGDNNARGYNHYTYNFAQLLQGDNKAAKEAALRALQSKGTYSAKRALGHYFIEQNQFNEALTVFKELFKVHTDALQSYLDLSWAYRLNKEKDKAAALLFRAAELGGLSYFNFEQTPLRVEREIEAIIDQPQDSEEPRSKRIVIEWSDPESEFELIFVNPENKYFSKSYSSIQSLEEVSENKRLGLYSTEFEIDENLPGKWKVLVRYLGNKKQTPTVFNLKVVSSNSSDLQQKLGVLHQTSSLVHWIDVEI
jgi:tetratricopeptide (TPR) repeat protein